jgi:Protein of unknown function (DUF1189).
MNNTKLSFFQRVYYSVAGFDNYKLFISQKTGKTVVYLLLLSLFLSLIGLIQPFKEYNKIVNEIITGFDKAVPNFTFENGKLNVEGNMPIFYNEEGLTFIIDTSGKTDETILEKYDMAILITQDKMIQKNYANNQVTDFSMLQGFRLTKESVKRMLPIMKGFSIFIFIILPPFVVAGRFISALIASIIGMIINSAKNINLPYRDIFAISAHSLTTPLIIGTILDFTGIPTLLSTLIYYIIAGIYIWGALNSIKKQATTFQPPLID